MADDEGDGLRLLVADEIENVARVHVRDGLHRAERRAGGNDAAHDVAGLETAERPFERVARDLDAGGNGRAGGDGDIGKFAAGFPAAARGVMRLNRAISREMASISRGWNCFRISDALSGPSMTSSAASFCVLFSAAFSAGGFGWMFQQWRPWF